MGASATSDLAIAAHLIPKGINIGAWRRGARFPNPISGRPLRNQAHRVIVIAMQISAEGKIGIALGLVGLAGAGAMMVFPQDIEIGWVLIAIAVIGFIWLAINHLCFPKRSKEASTLTAAAQNGDIPPGTVV
jgi:hypothetical protein